MNPNGCTTSWNLTTEVVHLNILGEWRKSNAKSAELAKHKETCLRCNPLAEPVAVEWDGGVSWVVR